MKFDTWQFWIDVGGTFTDVIAQRPDGGRLRHKLLSTGVTRGSLATDSTRKSIVDPARRTDPDNFWTGYAVRLLETNGEVLESGVVAQFDRATGTLELERPWSHAVQPGQVYELVPAEPAPLVAIRYLLGLRLGEAIPRIGVRLGTTRGTNALLTRAGARTAFVTTKGFGDILHIGYQNRPRLFDLNIRKPQPLFSTVVEVEERVTADGKVLLAPDRQRVRKQLEELKQQNIESLAICLLHGAAYPEHERQVAEEAQALGFLEVSVSSDVSPLVKLVARGETTVLDAYLNPVLKRYVDDLRSALPGSDLRLLSSAGGLVESQSFSGKDSILSGPAGGVVGFSRVAQAAGFERAIGFDMGGTSTDVSRFDGRYELEFETEKAGVRVMAPTLAIETVAAGGGSICAFDGVKLVVGPASAGADPGPACYGRGGPLTITDVNLFLGRLLPDRFQFPLDRGAVERHLDALVEQIASASRVRYTPHELAAGFVQVANASMAKAIRSISIAKGCDPRTYPLVAFGGAAGQHACQVARELGIREVLIHPDAGLLSALGIGLADVQQHRVVAVYQPYTDVRGDELAAMFDSMTRESSAAVMATGLPAEALQISRALDLRYTGVDAYLTIPEPASGDYPAAFEAEHRKRYGYVHAGRDLELVAARVEVSGRSSAPLPLSKRASQRAARAEGNVMSYFNGQLREIPVVDREQLSPGDHMVGPTIVVETTATTVVDDGWEAEVLSQRELLLTDRGSAQASPPGEQADPIMLEIFNNTFAGIAEQMGITLRNTSTSVNVKERLDFSCAIFTPTGDLVVNAPHIPVHLGAMAETVRQIISDNPSMQAGDVYVTNDPYQGGSHLPDVTVVSPVHDATSGQLTFFTASRAHHAEIGGIVPGSMPAFSRNLGEEGVLIRNFKLFDRGQARWDELEALLTAGPYPSRSPQTNLADIAAQVAANRQGAHDLTALADRYTLGVVQAYMRHMQAAAEQKVRAALARLRDGRKEFLDYLDDGTPIAVAITITRLGATLDFTGTGPVGAGNLNANRAITTAAVMYVLRSLVEEDIPLNQGVLAPIRLIVPEGLLSPPAHPDPRQCAAVVGGNVETSQRIVDVLLGGFGAAAASQGTMNNLLFGDATFGYYETICGGAGATSMAAGADAVHTHMTNTRLTDPEVLERNYPVRLREFRIRRGSGGRGAQPGGNGVLRRLEFLQPLEVSILSQRRGPYPPYGLFGGGPGAVGRNTLVRRDATVESLGSLAQFTAAPGDILIIETPGGGGWGCP